MANSLDFNQCATLLNEAVYQATGQRPLAPTNTSEFVSVAQTALKVGYDPILNAISQMQTRTIFSSRPYSRKFSGLQMSESRWGNYIRKLAQADLDVVDDERFKWPVAYDATQTANPLGNGQAVDMFKIRKPKVLQTMFYGQDVYEDYVTVFKDQLDSAFKGPEEFGSFYAMLTQERANKLEQYYENIARLVLANLMAGIASEAKEGRVIHLLTEYNTLTGLSLTATTVYQPENFKAFMDWVFARIATLASMFTERSTLFQTEINNFPIRRFTPYDRLKIYLFAGTQYMISSMVLPNTFNEGMLRFADHETVNFWQSITSPSAINMTPVYTATDGTLAEPENPVAINNVFGVLFDEEAAGYAVTNQWSSTTPFNAAGGYWNIFDHTNVKPFNDFTEKAVLLMLD